MWNDIGYPAAADLGELFAYYYNSVPEGVINDRFTQSREQRRKAGEKLLVPHGPHFDYITPEYATFDEIQEVKWECCRGIGHSFGYNRNEGDEQLLAEDELIHMFVDIVSKNGNLLLNVGPMADGTIPENQAERLRSLGRWLDRNGAAIFDTRPWQRADGVTTQGLDLRFTKADDALYVTLCWARRLKARSPLKACRRRPAPPCSCSAMMRPRLAARRRGPAPDAAGLCRNRTRIPSRLRAWVIELTAKVDQYVQKNLPWNFSVNLIDITFITLAFSVISRETIMPLLIDNLTDSKIAIGLVPAIFSIAFYLPQLFAANHAERLTRKLPFVMLDRRADGARALRLFAGIAVYFFAQSNPTLALLAVYLVIGLGAFGAGVATPAWFSMIGKVLPVNRRGIFFGVSDGLGTLMGIIGAYFVGVMLDDVAIRRISPRYSLWPRFSWASPGSACRSTASRKARSSRSTFRFSALLSAAAGDIAAQSQLPPLPAELFHQPLELDGRRLFHRLRQRSF